MCLSLVAAAVVIRKDSSSSKGQEDSSTVTISANPINKRSAVSENTTSSGVIEQTSSGFSIEDKAGQHMLNSDISTLLSSDSRNVPVPIKVIIDSHLIAPQFTSQPAHIQVQSSNVDNVAEIPDKEKNTHHLMAAIQSGTQSPANSSDRFVIEMDIKVKKIN